MGQRDKEKAKIQAERGQALTEVLIALGISTIIIASVAAGVILTVRSNSQGVMVRQAVSLAEELADKLRSIAEGQWQTLYNLSAKGFGGGTPISAVNKIAESTGTDGASFTTTGTLNPVANKLYLAVVTNSKTTPAIPDPVSLTGGGLTWTQVASSTHTALRLTVFRALSASPGAAATLTASAQGGVSQTGWTIIVVELDGIDTSGVNGAGAIVQSVAGDGGSALGGSLTLAAFGDPTNNAAFAAWEHQAAEATTPEAGWTELADITRTTPSRGAETEWRTGQDTTPTASWATSADWVGVAVEIKAAPGTATDYYVVQSSTSTWAIVQGAEGVLENEIRAGLVGHWGFDEATTTTAYDSSGNANNGTLTNGPTRTASSGCKISQCLSFDGVDDYVRVSAATSLNTTSKITILAWIKPQGSSGQPIVEYNNGLTYGVHFWQWNSFDQLYVNLIDTAGGNHTLTSPAGQFTAGNWYFVGVTYDGNYARLYVNGNEVASASLGSFTLQTTYDLAIGKRLSSTNIFNGLIDDVRIYNRALSADEVRQIYKARVFTRSFVVENVNRDANQNIVTAGGTEDPSTQKITIKVNWSLAAGSSQLNLVEYLTRFRNEVTRFTDWSGQEGVAGPITTPDSNFFSQSGISTSTAGEIKLAN